ncbi:MAG: MFS transporter, partial [Thermoplasmata archaeon]
FIYLFSFVKMQNTHKIIIYSAIFAFALAINVIFYSYYAFIISLIIGGISLSGRDLTPNQPIEQYAIGMYEGTQKSKNMAFSVYNFLSYGAGVIASAFLFLFRGNDFRMIFAVILALSLVQLILYLPIKFPQNRQVKAVDLNADTRKHVSVLSVLFSMDAFGGGLVTSSIISLWFKDIYLISLSTAGLIFIFVNAITAVSVIISGLISGKIGLIRTMVYTHGISNVFLMLVPVIHSLAISEVFLFLRQTTSQMDVPARDSLVNSIIEPDYRIKSNSIFASVRNGFQIPGPGLAGYFLSIYPPLVFIFSGAVKLSYDLSLYFKYRNLKI